MQDLFMFMYVVYQNIVMIDWALKFDYFFRNIQKFEKNAKFH